MKRKNKQEKLPSSSKYEETQVIDDAEDAMNELLSMYGYETVKKGELNGLKSNNVPPGNKPNPGRLESNGKGCRFCSKTPAWVFEKAPMENETTLGFCSTACLNEYKLEIFRREAEACLLDNSLPSGPTTGSDDDVSDKPGCSSALLITPQSWKSTDSDSKSKHHQSAKSGSCKKVSEKSANFKKRKASASAPAGAIARPHPYHVLNKKYWQNAKSASPPVDKSNESSLQEPVDIVNCNSTIVQISTENNDPVSGQLTMDGVIIEEKTDNPPVEEEKQLGQSSALVPYVASKTVPPPASQFPLNIVWIPFPFPIPIPIPIPIPYPVPVSK